MTNFIFAKCMSISIYKSPSGTSNILAFNRPGGTQKTQLNTSVPGSVVGYSYISGINGATSLTIDAGSNLYATGFANPTVFPQSIGSYPQPYNIPYPAFSGTGPCITKYDKNGNILGLSRSINSTTNAVSSAVDAGSNVYVLLSVVANATLYGISPYSTTSSGPTPSVSVLFIKYSPSGSVLGYTSVSSPATNAWSKIAVDAGSNVYVSGRYISTSALPVYNIGNPPTSSGISLPPTNPVAGFQASWPVILKWSATGSFLGYSVVRIYAGITLGGSSSGLTIAFDASSNVYWSGLYTSNIFCNVNSISSTEPTVNNYSLNTTGSSAAPYGNAFVINFNSSGSVLRFTEIGQTYLFGRSPAINFIKLSRSGNVYMNASVSYPTAGSAIQQFGLANPGGASPTYLPVSAVIMPTTNINGGCVLLCYNSSTGSVLGAACHTATSSANAFEIDANDNMYQQVYYANIAISLVNIDGSASGFSIAASGQTNNNVLVKFNPGGQVVAFSTMYNTNGNQGSMVADLNYLYYFGRFNTVANPGTSNVTSISTNPVIYATLPSSGISIVLEKWKL